MTDAVPEKLDPGEVAALYVAHADQLKQFLWGVLRSEHQALDVLQTAFAKLAERGHECRPESRRSWLFRVAFNEALLVRRRRQTADRVLREQAGGGQPESPASDVPLLRSETIQRVRDALQLLPEAQRQVVWMRVYEDKTFAQIAETLGIPLGTALNRMRVATEKLRRHLGNQEGH